MIELLQGLLLKLNLPLDEFPSPDALWKIYQQFKGITKPEEERIISQEYFLMHAGRKPRYYQQIAINRTIEAIAKEQNRILLVMATGQVKPILLFKSFIGLWKAGVKKRILFLSR